MLTSVSISREEEQSMNLRHLPNRISTSILVLLFGSSLLGWTARPASAQSVTVTMPFAFCINDHAYAKGRYRFTPISPWLVSIRDVNGTHESFFDVHPGDDDQQASARPPLHKNGKLTFLVFQGVRELRSLYIPGSYASLELFAPVSGAISCPVVVSTIATEIAAQH